MPVSLSRVDISDSAFLPSSAPFLILRMPSLRLYWKIPVRLTLYAMLFNVLLMSNPLVIYDICVSKHSLSMCQLKLLSNQRQKGRAPTKNSAFALADSRCGAKSSVGRK